MNIGIVCIGDELLIGQVIDTNSAIIAQILGDNGLKVSRKWTVGDNILEIQYALQEASKSCNLIIMTGGLGPTKDDITKKVIADFFDVDLVFSEENYLHIKQIFDARKIELKEAHKTQCYVPANAELLNNKVGTAMGMWINHEEKVYISLPGVPDEMKHILQEEVISRVCSLANGIQFASRTFHTCGYGETEIAAQLEPLCEEDLDFIQIAYLPAIAQVRFRISASHTDKTVLNSKLDMISEKIRNAFGSIVFGEGKTNLALELGKLLIARNWQIASVESCTGGLLASKLTSNPGSSIYYKGGLVTYATTMKEELLGVSKVDIAEKGVVSEEIVRAMVIHTVKLLKVDMAIATTGIAGPDGGTEQIPVGIIFIACGNEHEQIFRRLRLSKNRDRNIEAASILSLNLAREWLLSKS